LNRITYYELDQLRTRYPEVLNGLETDNLYPKDKGSLPDRTKEVLQAWQAIKSLCDDLCKGDANRDLDRCRKAIMAASDEYDEIAAAAAINLDPKSDADHLPALEEGLKLFMRLAEIANTGSDSM
jgi:hypothetical protein